MRLFSLAAAAIAVLLEGSGLPLADVGVFDPQDHPDLMASIPPAYTEKVVDVLQGSKGNWEELARALREVGPEGRETMAMLISDLGAPDRFFATGSLLMEHVEYVSTVGERVRYPVPGSQEEVFRTELLSPRIGTEWIEPWRKALYERFYPLVKDARRPEEAARILNRWTAEHMEIHPAWQARWSQTPVMTLRGKGGDEASIAVFTVAALRSVGIPSRMASVDFLGDTVGGAVWVEFFNGAGWLPLYPHDVSGFGDFGRMAEAHRRAVPFVYAGEKNVTEQYTEMGTLRVHVVGEGGKSLPDSVREKGLKLSVNVFNDGAWRSVTDRMGWSFTPDEDGFIEIRLGVGAYLLEAATRESPLGVGDVLIGTSKRASLIALRRITVEGNKTTEVRVEMNGE